ncbi:MAG: N-acetyltransferase family protein [Actinomycetota bacterium]
MQLETTLKNGLRATIRPISPVDKWRLQEGLKALSPESRYRRFFREVDHFTAEQLTYLTEVDGTNHVAWIALDAEHVDSPGLGVARWIRISEEPTSAEAAVTVLDQWHGQGLGSTLMWLLAKSAIENGVTHFRVWTLGENLPLLRLLQGFGVKPRNWEAGVAELLVPLPASLDDLSQTPAPLILRATATGELLGRARPDAELGTELEPGSTNRAGGGSTTELRRAGA